MSGRTLTGDGKITLALRPRSNSKSRKPTRRRRTPTNNEVVFANPAKHHVSTNFPLFSNNLVAKKPQVAQKSNVATLSCKNKQITHHQRTTSNAAKSPTPVEVPSRFPNHTRPQAPDCATSVKSELIHVVGGECNDQSPRSLYATPETFICDSHCDSDFFPFQYLPDDCKLKVFSLLTIHDKGRCAQVRLRVFNS